MRCVLPIMIFAVVSAGAPSQRLFGAGESAVLLSRPDPRIDDDGAYIFDIRRGAKEDSSARELTAALPNISAQDHALIILSHDRGLAARITRKAFSLCPPNSLRSLEVHCMVGPCYDPYIRRSVTKTGATLTTSIATSIPSDLNSAGRRRFYQGQADARRDIVGNRLVLRGSFPPRPFQKLLREKYNIEAPIITPYKISLEDWAYDAGYNSVSIPEMERRHGEYFTERALIESRKKAYAHRKT